MNFYSPNFKLTGIIARGFSEKKDFWPLVQASDIFKLNYGKSLVETSRKAGTVPVYGTNGQCGWHDKPLFQGPGVILGRKGQGPLGVEWSDNAYWVIDTAYSLEILSSEVDLKYAYYLIKFVGLNHLKDGTSNPSLSRDTFGVQLFPKPLLQIQRRIAHILGTLDDTIELNRRMNATLEAMARALFRSWFVDFDPVQEKAEGRQPAGMDDATAALFPDEFEASELGEIPMGWDVKSLGDLVSFEYGKPLKEENRSGGKYPVYGSGGQIGWHDEFLVSGPGIIIGRKGNPGIVNWSSKSFYPIDTTFYVKIKNKINIYYIYYAILNSGLDALNSDSAVPGLNRNIACKEGILVPSHPLQEKYSTFFIRIREKIDSNENEIQTLAALRDALLPRLLSGELLMTATVTPGDVD